jgi:hypothetical protein
MPEQDIQTFDEIVYGDGDSDGVGTYVLEEGTKKLTLEFTRPKRATRQRVQNELPAEFFEAAEQADSDNPDEDEISDLAEEVNLQDLVFSEAAVEAWDEMIIEAINGYGATEIRDLLETLPDPVYYDLGGEILSFTADGAEIEGFRR